jgi:hypothetical protein
LIPNAETIELSYNKRESVLAESESALREKIAESMLQTWAPAASGSIIRTTGGTVAAHLPSATGNRKKIIVSDLKNAQLHMNKQNIPMEERYALLSADMFQQLSDDLITTSYRDFSIVFDAKNGVLGKLFGFNIMVRSTVLAYDNSGTPALNTSGPATTDNDAVLCWQQHAVERAVGSINFFEKVNDPTYYGDVYSISMFMGGRKRRNDEKGVLVIVQDTAS